MCTPVKPKEIFYAVLPEGYKRLLQPGDKGDDNFDSKKMFYADCPKCKRRIYSESSTRYSNPVTHYKTCYGAK